MENKNIDYEKILRDLLEQKQYTKLRQEIADMNPADVAAVMDEMEDDESLRIFRILPKGIAADVFLVIAFALILRREKRRVAARE